MPRFPMLSPEISAMLRAGIVIPAHPLALTGDRRLDERRQIALTRYYCDAGARGVAIGVHTTQFAIRDPRIGLFEPVLKLGIEAVRSCERQGGKKIVTVAGICGTTDQAVKEALKAHEIGYDLGLLSLGAMAQVSETELLAHCRRVAEIIPLFGFYLQPAAGGRLLAYSFWRGFLEIENVAAIKVAAFNRYQTLDVLRALAGSGRSGEVALYTGNDDNIVADLVTEFRISEGGKVASLRFAGGLLGHWAVWTKRAAELLDTVLQSRRDGCRNTADILAQSAEVTDSNAAFFDPANGFAGCIAGLHEVLRRQGLMAGRWCLNPAEDLSPGQMEEIDRVYKNYPHLNDDAFVKENLDRWLKA